MEQNAQQIMWGIVGPTFWTGYAIFCTLGGLLLFGQILRSVERNALTVARCVWLGGFILGAFVRVNSACQPLSAALFATGGTMMTVLLVTQWCHRPGSAKTKVLAIIREALYPETKKAARE